MVPLQPNNNSIKFPQEADGKNFPQENHVSLPPLNFPLLAEGGNLEKIPFYSSSGELTYLSHEEFHVKFGCHYSQSFFMPDQSLQAEFKQDLNHAVTELDAKARETFKTPSTSVAIYDIGNADYNIGNADTCYGCKAIKDIPYGTCVLIRNGVISSLYKSSDYVRSVPSLDNVWISDEEIGGVARFINHYPSSIERFRLLYRKKDEIHLSSLEDVKLKEELSKILNEPGYFEQSLAWHGGVSDADFCFSVTCMDQYSQSELATANLQSIKVDINGIPAFALFALCDIKKGDILGIDYGMKYWNARENTPTYFKKNGEVISAPPSNTTLTCPNKTALEIKNEAIVQYELGVKAYTQGNYHRAFQLILKAISIFSHSKSDNISELITCYSTLASLFRNLNMEPAFFAYCDIAIKLAFDFNKFGKIQNSFSDPVFKKYSDYVSAKFLDKTQTAEKLLMQGKYYLSSYAFVQLIVDLTRAKILVPVSYYTHLAYICTETKRGIEW